MGHGPDQGGPGPPGHRRLPAGAGRHQRQRCRRHPPGPRAELRRARTRSTVWTTAYPTRRPAPGARRPARTARTSPARSPRPATASASSEWPRVSGSRRSRWSTTTASSTRSTRSAASSGPPSTTWTSPTTATSSTRSSSGARTTVTRAPSRKRYGARTTGPRIAARCPSRRPATRTTTWPTRPPTTAARTTRPRSPGPINNDCLDMPTELPGVITVASTDHRPARGAASRTSA